VGDTDTDTPPPDGIGCAYAEQRAPKTALSNALRGKMNNYWITDTQSRDSMTARMWPEVMLLRL